METIYLKIFGYDNDDWAGHFLSWNHGKTTYKNIQIVSDDSYTHAVVFGVPYQANYKSSKENTIGFQCEPFEIVRIKNHEKNISSKISDYYCIDPDRMKGDCFKKGVSFIGPVPMTEISKDGYQDQKTEIMSIVASDKKFLEGHRLRHSIINRILKSDMNIHIYGRNLERLYRNDERVKGTLQVKANGFIPYRYSICIENVFYGFVTEKLYDPILFECLPVYAGGLEQPFLPIHDDYNISQRSEDEVFEKICEVYNSGTGVYDKHFDTLNKARNSMLNVENTMPEFLYQRFNRGN